MWWMWFFSVTGINSLPNGSIDFFKRDLEMPPPSTHSSMVFKWKAQSFRAIIQSRLSKVRQRRIKWNKTKMKILIQIQGLLMCSRWAFDFEMAVFCHGNIIDTEANSTRPTMRKSRNEKNHSSHRKLFSQLRTRQRKYYYKLFSALPLKQTCQDDYNIASNKISKEKLFPGGSLYRVNFSYAFPANISMAKRKHHGNSQCETS